MQSDLCLVVPGRRFSKGRLFIVPFGECLVVDDSADKSLQFEPSSSGSADERGRQFVKLLAACERRLYDYIFALVGNFADADEIAQDTKLRLWEQFDQFEPGTNFAAWACTVARYRVLDHRKAAKREHILLSDEFCQRLADSLSSQTEDLAAARLRALQTCLEQMPPEDRELLMYCYASHGSTAEISNSVNKSRAAVYQWLWRVRGKLLTCIERRMAEEA
jgi:RNA polymerase sigma-70 factor (ECF subfamily)